MARLESLLVSAVNRTVGLRQNTNLNFDVVLAVCTRIREETMLIFYLNNNFHIWIDNWNPLPLRTWETKRQELDFYGYELGDAASIRPYGDPNWHNLCEWLKQWHEGTIRPLQVQPTHDSWTAVSSPPMYMTIALIFFTVDTLRAESWT
jgi:hypothetical protein